MSTLKSFNNKNEVQVKEEHKDQVFLSQQQVSYVAAALLLLFFFYFYGRLLLG